MNRNAQRTAADIISESTEADLRTMLNAYSDLKRPGNVVKAILKARKTDPSILLSVLRMQ